VPFSVIIATCGRPASLRVAIEAVLESCAVTGTVHEIVVVDNGRKWDAESVSASFAADRRASVRYVKSRPLSKSEALNNGIATASNQRLAFTDDDTLPNRKWLLEGEKYFAATGLRAFGGRVLPGDCAAPLPSWLRKGASGRLPHGGAIIEYDPLDRSGVLSDGQAVPFGANFFAVRDVFDEHGGYDEVLWNLCGRAAVGVEDGEMGVRLRSKGEKIGYCREAVVIHPLHPERFSIQSHFRVGYRYGWRDPFVFYRRDRPAFERYNLRLIVRSLAGMGWAMARGDSGAAVADAVDIAMAVGRIRGRLSRAYGKWTRILEQRQTQAAHV
jgi:GT2 family glycosyltransferase